MSKVEIKPHPKDVIDVHPDVIAGMKRRLKTPSPKGKSKPKKDIMDDSLHYEVKKAAPLDALADWLAKAAKGSGGKGRIMGQTDSGKTIHFHPDHPEHAGFSKQDHLDAMEHHITAQGPIDHALHMYHAGRNPMPHGRVAGLTHDLTMHRKFAQSHSDKADDVKKSQGPASRLQDWLAKAEASKVKAKRKKKLKKDGPSQPPALDPIATKKFMTGFGSVR